MEAELKLGLACSHVMSLFSEFDYSRRVYAKAPSLEDISDDIIRGREFGYVVIELEALTREQLHEIESPKNISKLKQLCKSERQTVTLFTLLTSREEITRGKTSRRLSEDICQAASALGPDTVVTFSAG